MKKLLLCCSIIIFTLYGCKDDDLSTSNSPDEGSQVTINIENLPSISETAKYQAWFYGENAAVGKIGVLTPDANGKVDAVFDVKLSEMKRAKYILVTVEPNLHDSLILRPGPLRLIAGTIGVNSAALTAQHDLAKKLNFTEAAGKYTLYTPTSAATNDEKSGVWFVELLNNTASAGLNLPPVPAGCAYQGWVITNGQTISTGKFTVLDDSDLDDTYSDELAAPKFPGEDFIKEPPAGFTFPLDLSGASLFITLESSADVSDLPAGVKVLQATIPADAAASTTYQMQPVNNTIPSPSGSLVMKVKIN